MKRCILKIKGRVQGVGYRASALREGLRLGLTGWVCNCFDGSVEAVVEGKPEKIEAFVAWCHRGPALAHVLEVKISQAPATGEFQDFFIR
ncbi:MAG: acylphosphatase [Deltaproteobacteria bacterium GWA2_45_12]|nr:MAG: acylphosphatase [Deltaproteobacteria bacterium GWA2_45_12]